MTKWFIVCRMGLAHKCNNIVISILAQWMYHLWATKKNKDGYVKLTNVELANTLMINRGTISTYIEKLIEINIIEDRIKLGANRGALYKMNELICNYYYLNS